MDDNEAGTRVQSKTNWLLTHGPLIKMYLGWNIMDSRSVFANVCRNGWHLYLGNREVRENQRIKGKVTVNRVFILRLGLEET